MSFKYVNITGVNQTIALISEDKTAVSHIILSPGSDIEVNVELDVYVPHILAKYENGVNITMSVIKARQEAVKEAIKEAGNEPDVVQNEKIESAKPEEPVKLEPELVKVPEPKQPVSPKHVKQGRPKKV